MEIRAIHNEDDYTAQLAIVSDLVDLDPEVGTAEGDELKIRALLVEDYERQHFPIDMPDPIEAIMFRMDQMGLVPKDLVPIIGPRHRVHEVLTRKRNLTLQMIRKANQQLQIPAQALIGSTKTMAAKKSGRSGRELTV